MGKLLIAAFFVLSAQTGWSNSADSTKYELTVYSGIRTILCDSLPANTDLDLANTIMDEQPTAYIGLNLNVNWHPKFSTAIDWLIIDSYVFNNFRLSAQYNITEFFGLRAGYYSFDYFLQNEMDYFIDNYDKFFTRTITNPYIYEDDNFFQDRIKDQGFILGPVFKLEKPRFTFNLYLNWGITRHDKYNLSFVAKELNTNKKQKIVLETTKSQSPIFFPEFNLKYRFMQKRRLNLGLQIHGNIYYQDKIMNYEKTVYEWTDSNIDRLLVDSPRHRFFKYEIDIGIIFAW